MEQFRIFKRKIYDKMLQWKQTRDGSTALLLKGARRVGKSTIVEEFARREYESYILVDFADARLLYGRQLRTLRIGTTSLCNSNSSME